MRIKVMKFGGTSVATPEARNLAAQRVISAKEHGFSPIVVVSAIGRKGEPYATDTFIQLVRDIDPNIPPEPRELDLLIACGEILSSVVFAQTLKVLGHSAQAFRGGQAGIRTDGVFGNARIVAINPVALVRSAEQGYIPVVCGFQGTYVGPEPMPGAELTTLGRGGSDTTAAALGVALNAECVEIFTDVDGVKTADPDAVADAPTLRRVTYDEVAEIAHLGAKVIHPRAAEIAMTHNVPLWVKNTFTDDEGTLIVGRPDAGARRLTGVAHTGQLVYLQFDLNELSPIERTRLEATLYDMMSRQDINLYMLNLGPSGTGFGVSREQYPVVEELLDSLVVPVENELGLQRVFVVQLGNRPSDSVVNQLELLASLGLVQAVSAERTEGCTMVSLVGDATMKQPGLFAAVFRTLSESQIPVLQTADSDFSLSVLIPESECNRAVRLIHERFDLAAVN
jgi:aspartate kinase